MSAAKRGSLRQSARTIGAALSWTAPAMPWPRASRTPVISRAPAPHAAWKTRPPVDSSASAIDAAAASNTPAAVRTMPSMTERKPSVASMLVASDAPCRVLSGRPSASANAAALEIRRSGMNSMPVRSAASSTGDTSA
jgi:hypothetical protein